jgi:hypothetical protein
MLSLALQKYNTCESIYIILYEYIRICDVFLGGTTQLALLFLLLPCFSKCGDFPSDTCQLCVCVRVCVSINVVCSVFPTTITPQQSFYFRTDMDNDDFFHAESIANDKNSTASC